MTSIHNATQDFATDACRAGSVQTAELEQSDPIFLSSSFCFESAEQAARRFAGDEAGNVYSRFTNPTVRAFETRLAALEGGERALATASGMSAVLTTCMGLLQAGDHVVSSHSIFGATVNLFKNVLERFGLEFSFVDLVDTAAWERAIKPNTKLLFLETPSNPLTEIGDIQALADIAHAHGCLLVVDNCFCTPALQRPLSLGADVIVHSATKYLDGQGRCVGGAVVADDELVEQRLVPFLRSAGPSMSPFNAWVFLKGLETLEIRMQRHSQSALELATWLQGQSGVERVYYPGLSDHPQHALARRQQSDFGGIVSFELAGGREAAWSLVDRVQRFSITANLGDSRSIITHPASTTHGRLSDDERQAMGVGEGLVRLSIGLENVADLIADLATNGALG